MRRNSLRSKIPAEIRDVLSGDEFMKTCVVSHECLGKIEWHHAMTYAGKRVNELWSLLPLCKRHHDRLTKHTQAICRMNLRARISHFKAEEEFASKYPKSDLFALQSSV